MTNLDSVLKSRDITFPTKVHMVKAMVLCVYVFVSAYPQWPHLWLWKNDATTMESSDHSQNGDFWMEMQDTCVLFDSSFAINLLCVSHCTGSSFLFDKVQKLVRLCLWLFSIWKAYRGLFTKMRTCCRKTTRHSAGSEPGDRDLNGWGQDP